nr:MAG TPA: hypothetical protein [Caudoviricetes sp.]
MRRPRCCKRSRARATWPCSTSRRWTARTKTWKRARGTLEALSPRSCARSTCCRRSAT